MTHRNLPRERPYHYKESVDNYVGADMLEKVRPFSDPFFGSFPELLLLGHRGLLLIHKAAPFSISGKPGA
jgi:hypothetical protein